MRRLRVLHKRLVIWIPLPAQFKTFSRNPGRALDWNSGGHFTKILKGSRSLELSDKCFIANTRKQVKHLNSLQRYSQVFVLERTSPPAQSPKWTREQYPMDFPGPSFLIRQLIPEFWSKIFELYGIPTKQKQLVFGP